MEEIDEALEIDKNKIKNIVQAPAQSNIVFELTEVIKGGQNKTAVEQGNEPEYGRDRAEDEERTSYVITIKKRKFRPIVEETTDSPQLELDEEPERKYTVMLD